MKNLRASATTNSIHKWLLESEFLLTYLDILWQSCLQSHMVSNNDELLARRRPALNAPVIKNTN